MGICVFGGFQCHILIFQSLWWKAAVIQVERFWWAPTRPTELEILWTLLLWPSKFRRQAVLYTWGPHSHVLLCVCCSLFCFCFVFFPGRWICQSKCLQQVDRYCWPNQIPAGTSEKGRLMKRTCQSKSNGKYIQYYSFICWYLNMYKKTLHLPELALLRNILFNCTGLQM